MRVLVLGATGQIGVHAVRALAARPDTEVTAVARGRPADGLFPASVAVRALDAVTATEEALASLLRGHDGAVVAFGLDDRRALPLPAWAALSRTNVDAVARIARVGAAVGVRRLVVCGSYFTYLVRTRPDLRLEQRHPYVRSRVAQARALFGLPDGPRVVVLEIPYVFGPVPGRPPLWAPLVAYARSSLPLVCVRGGTAMVAVQRVAEAIVGGLGDDVPEGLYPLGDAFLSWRAWFETFARLAGRPRRARRLPPALARAALAGYARWLRARGLEHGLDLRFLVDLAVEDARVEAEDLARTERTLGVGRGGLEAAFGATVTASSSPASVWAWP